MKSGRMLVTTVVLLLMALWASQALAQKPQNPGIFQPYSAPVSSTLRFWASDAGKDLLLHSPSPMALLLLQKFHPDAAGQYPQQPMLQPGPRGGVRPAISVTGCGSSSGTVMNLEPSTNAVGQYQPSIDFLLSELGSGKDLVVEAAHDLRGLYGTFDSNDAEYVHRDGTQSCYGGSDFEMGNPPIADPYFPGDMLYGIGNARVLADPNASRKQFIFADLRYNGTTSGIGLRRISASNFENTGTCPAGTLNQAQEATCAGTHAIIVDASLDNYADSPSIAQDPRTSGTGAGDIYIVDASYRYLRTVISIIACKPTFNSASDCSPAYVISGSQSSTQFPSIAVVAGGANAGNLVISFVGDDGIEYVNCTPAGAPSHPVCHSPQVINDSDILYTSLADNPLMYLTTWPQIAVRTDGSGQTIFVVWSDCKLATAYPLYGCPDANVVMSTATSITGSSWSFRHVRTSTGHQFLPAIAYDTGQNIINIAYYDTGSDHYKNRTVMGLNQIASGTTTVGSTVHLTTSYDSLQGDGTTYPYDYSPGDYIGLAAHGGSGAGSSRIYVGFVNNARNGTYSGVSNTQADNNVSRATY